MARPRSPMLLAFSPIPSGSQRLPKGWAGGIWLRRPDDLYTGICHEKRGSIASFLRVCTHIDELYFKFLVHFSKAGVALSFSKA